MWNAAYSYGGPACTIQQFEQTTGVRIDNYVVVDFGSFQDMVDAVDGVEVCVPEDIDSSEYGITIQAGTRTLNGKEALAYVRVRHGVGDGSDIGRIKRQQAFIAALAEKVLSGGTLTRFDRLVRFLNAATKSLTTDIPNIKEMAKVGLQFKDIGLKRIRFITVPFVYSTAQPGRVEWTDDADVLWDRIVQRQAARQAPGRLDRRRPGAGQRPVDLGDASSTRARARATRVRRHSSPSDSSPSTESPSTPPRRATTRPRHRRERGRPRVRRALLVTDRSSPTAGPSPSRTGSASAGWPRCSATCCRTPPPTSATPPSARTRDRARRHLAQGAGAAAPRRLVRSGAGRRAATRTGRRAGRGSPGAA